MKGVILHGGHGTRLRPLTHTGPKQLLPIANKPMSQYAIEQLREAGVDDIAIIIGDVYPEKVKEFYGNGEKLNVKLSYIYQDNPKGIAHAVRLCKEFVGNDKFVVYLGDNILRKGIDGFAKKFISSNDDALILLCKVDDPSRFGVADIENNKIKKIVEKPKNPTSDLAVIGVYFLSPKIFDIIDQLKPSWRDELEITDSLQLLMDNGLSVQYDTVTGWWKDTGTPEDILDANRLILDSIGNSERLILDDDYQIKGNIMIGKNTTISKDSTIIGPTKIGKNCTIGPRARIGPHVSVGDNSVLKNCDVANSIFMNNCNFDSKIHLSDSIISDECEIIDNPEPKKHQMLLGERSKIKL